MKKTLLIAIALVAALTAITVGVVAPSASAEPGVGTPEVTIDFSTYGLGVFQPDFYRSDGILFPPETCGSSGCAPLLVSLVQDDDALEATPSFGPVQATFTRPISDLSVHVAPTLQGTATYVLNAYAASGKLVGTSAVTVTEDFGDPANTGFGYFSLSLANLPQPAMTFTLDDVFVRSSFPQTTEIPYGVSSISYVHWGGQS